MSCHFVGFPTRGILFWFAVLIINGFSSSGRCGASAKGISDKEGNFPENWIRVQSDEGEEYFWNTVTGETSWEHPASRSTAVFNESAAQQAWTQEIDPQSGSFYYFNHITGESKWDKPTESLQHSEETDEYVKPVCGSYVQQDTSAIVADNRVGMVISDYGDSDPRPLTIQWATHAREHDNHGTALTTADIKNRSFLVKRSEVRTISADNVLPEVQSILLKVLLQSSCKRAVQRGEQSAEKVKSAQNNKEEEGNQRQIPSTNEEERNENEMTKFHRTQEAAQEATQETAQKAAQKAAQETAHELAEEEEEKSKVIEKEIERKETERKEKERKEIERKEKERKEKERKEREEEEEEEKRKDIIKLQQAEKEEEQSKAKQRKDTEKKKEQEKQKRQKSMELQKAEKKEEKSNVQHRKEIEKEKEEERMKLQQVEQDQKHKEEKRNLRVKEEEEHSKAQQRKDLENKKEEEKKKHEERIQLQNADKQERQIEIWKMQQAKEEEGEKYKINVEKEQNKEVERKNSEKEKSRGREDTTYTEYSQLQSQATTNKQEGHNNNTTIVGPKLNISSREDFIDGIWGLLLDGILRGDLRSEIKTTNTQPELLSLHAAVKARMHPLLQHYINSVASTTKSERPMPENVCKFVNLIGATLKSCEQRTNILDRLPEDNVMSDTITRMMSEQGIRSSNDNQGIDESVVKVHETKMLVQTENSVTDTVLVNGDFFFDTKVSDQVKTISTNQNEEDTENESEQDTSTRQQEVAEYHDDKDLTPWSTIATSVPIKGVDTKLKKDGIYQVLPLIQHSAGLDHVLNSQNNGFVLTFVSRSHSNKRPYSHIPIRCGKNPSRKGLIGFSIGHRTSQEELEIRVGNSKELFVKSIKHDFVAVNQWCNRTLVMRTSLSSSSLNLIRTFELWIDGTFTGSVIFESEVPAGNNRIYEKDESSDIGCLLGDVWDWRFVGDIDYFELKVLQAVSAKKGTDSNMSLNPSTYVGQIMDNDDKNFNIKEVAKEEVQGVNAEETPEMPKTKNGFVLLAERRSEDTKPQKIPVMVEHTLVEESETAIFTQSMTTSDDKQATNVTVKETLAEKKIVVKMELEVYAQVAKISTVTDAMTSGTVMAYRNRLTGDEGERQISTIAPNHDKLKAELVVQFEWNFTDIDTWVKKWGVPATNNKNEQDGVSPLLLAAAKRAQAAAAAAELALAAANAENTTHKFVVLQSIAFRKSTNIDDKHKSGGVRQGAVVSGRVLRHGQDLIEQTENTEENEKESSSSNLLSIVNATDDSDLWLEILNQEGVRSATEKGTGRGRGKRNTGRRGKKKKNQQQTVLQRRRLEGKKQREEAARKADAEARYFIPVRINGRLTAIEHGTPERHFVAQESVAFRSTPNWHDKTPGGVRDGDLVRTIAGCEETDENGHTWVQSIEGSWLPLKNTKGERLLVEQSIKVQMEKEEAAQRKVEDAAEKVTLQEEAEKALEEKGGKADTQKKNDASRSRRRRHHFSLPLVT